MTPEEELVRAVWDRWNSGLRTTDPELLQPDLEVHSALTGYVYRGEEGVQRWAAEIDDQFEHWEVIVAGTREVRPGLLIVEGEIHATGRGSGVDIDQPASWLVQVREGRIARIDNFIGTDSAAAAARQAGPG
jgi:ketosteroid isomerase-like protein